jgi:hypothetical protein
MKGTTRPPHHLISWLVDFGISPWLPNPMHHQVSTTGIGIPRGEICLCCLAAEHKADGAGKSYEATT